MQKNVKFHHLVSNLKVKRKEVVWEKNHPLFLLGQKILPQKSGVFFKISSPSLSPTNFIQENPWSCQVFRISQGSETNRNHPPGFFVAAFFVGKTKRSEAFCGFFCSFFQGTAACTDSMVPISGLSALKKSSEKVNELFLEIVPLKINPEKNKKKRNSL